MKKSTILKLTIVVVLVLFFPTYLFADAQIQEWFGKYAMNHDGWIGTLIISDSKVHCGGPPWCSMVIRYVDSNRVTRTGSIEKIEDKGLHMVFYIDFPGN